MNSIFKKMAFRITILFTIVMIVAGTGMVLSFNYMYKREVQRDLNREAQMIGRIIDNSNDIVNLADYIDSSGEIRFIVMSAPGRVIINTEEHAFDRDDFLSEPEVLGALSGSESVDIRFIKAEQETRMYVAIISSDDIIIRASKRLSVIELVAPGVMLPFFVITILSIVACLVVVLFVSRRITKPIIAIKNEAIRVMAGENEELQEYSSDDELESLSRAIDNMVTKLNSNIEDLAEKNSQINAVMQAIPGGILAVDANERVITANPAAMEMFSFWDRGADVKTLDIKKFTDLKKIVRKAMHASGVIEEELIIKDGKSKTILQVFAVPAHNEGVLHGVIVLAQDITQVSKLMSMQTDFIANASHELRTPLTVISGFVETLRVEKVPKVDAYRFLDIISLEIKRLTKLIDAILELSKLEPVSLFSGIVLDIRPNVNNAVEFLEVSAQIKKIELNVLMPEEEVLVFAKHERIYHMVFNLVDNAIKYTKEQGVITIEVKKQGKFAQITVEDNGIGIPAHDIPRLFERFYRVDKSRSRSLGGTGLGLAIVKQIVDLLNGKVEVESSLGHGTTFTVALPLAKQSKMQQL